MSDYNVLANENGKYINVEYDEKFNLVEIYICDDSIDDDNNAIISLDKPQLKKLIAKLIDEYKKAW